ncbi:Polycystic kidney disease protein 1-like 1 [Apodemus speciosus]|uniref:Polycystic kidney disease protein 1-like 1 n=1 Tax=Apodemus speciosus TaxID=105296 RepID=A0ABQ0F9B4_APOSI
MKFRAKIVDLACLNHFTRVSNMIAKLAKTCTLRISPEKLNFILCDKLASGGVSMWCELEQENFFSEFQMEGVSEENNAIYLELTSENLSRALKTAQNSRALKIKLTNKHFPCLTVSVELLSSSSSSRIVVHDIPIKIIPRRLWKDLQEPSVPDSDSQYLFTSLEDDEECCGKDEKHQQSTWTVNRVPEPPKRSVIEANLKGELNLKIETELVCVTTHFKDLENPLLPSDSVSQSRHPEHMAKVQVDIRKLLQFLAGQQVTPTKAVCNIDQKRGFQLVCSVSSSAETPAGAGEKECLRFRSCSLRAFCSGVLAGIQANLELCVSDEQDTCPSYAPKGTARDPESQTPSSPAPWDKNVLNASSEGRLSFVNREPQAPPDLDEATSRGVSSAAAPCILKKEVFCCDGQGPLCSEEDLAKMLLLSFSDPPPGISHTCNLSASWYHPESSSPLTQHPPGAILVTQPDNAGHFAICCFPETDAQAPPALGIRVHVASGTALCLLLDFGDNYGAEMRLCTMAGASTMTGYHQYRKEGVYKLKAIVCDFHGAEELGPYYVDIGHRNVSVFMNSSSIYDSEALLFADSLPEQKAVSFAWYHVKVKATSRMGSVVSEPHLIRVQKRIMANRLVSTASALVNANVSFECRLNFGTDVAYLWNFGDNTVELGSGSSSHVYSREGEFTVEVLAFNNVSSATLRKQLFIVQEPCQPPPVKNMGPTKVQAFEDFDFRQFYFQVKGVQPDTWEGKLQAELCQNAISNGSAASTGYLGSQQPQSAVDFKEGIWRSQPLRLGVTFEAAVLCNISQGISYTWSFVGAEATAVTLPAAVNTRRQTIVIPSYTLECGNYTAIAKVQIKGTVVYSNYCVGVEVRARAPVSVISEGTHIFISKATSTSIILRGSQSYDPDNPGAALRFVHISWVSFRDISVNWNEEVSLQAVCEDCGDVPDLTYSWDLFLVNATEKSAMEGSRMLRSAADAVGQLGASALRASLKSSESDLPSNLRASLTPQSLEPSPMPLGWTSLSNLGSVPAESSAGGHHVSAAGAASGSGEPVEGYSSLSPAPSSLAGEALLLSSPEGSWPSPSSSADFDDFEAYYSDIEEAIPSLGRQPGDYLSIVPVRRALHPGSLCTSPPGFTVPVPDIKDTYESPREFSNRERTSTRFQEAGPSLSAEESASYGDNLLGPFLHTGRAKPTLMIDWPKALVSQDVFHGYTTSGIMGPAVTIKPFSLSSGETYVLQASVVTGTLSWNLLLWAPPLSSCCYHTIISSKHVLLGKAQLYLTVNQAPQDMSCQVRPHHGTEAYTIFSVFCMSGKPDFHYEFRYQIGNTSSHTLYHGQDNQYYFLLPAGDSSDNYKVIVSTEITDGQGSKVQPCTVAVTVLPRYHEKRLPGQGPSKYNSTLETMMDSIHILRDLISFPNKLSLTSAMCIFKYAQMFLAQGQFSRWMLVNKKLGVEFVLLISGVWEAAKEDSRDGDYLQDEGMKIISDMLLACLSDEHQIRISTGQMEFQTLLHHSPQSSIQNLGFVRVHFPSDLALHGTTQEATHSPCYITQLMFFMKSPYARGQAPGKVGGVMIPRLYSCKSRRPILRGRLETAVTMEFTEEDHLHKRNPAMFVLLRDEVNVHRFTGLSENPQESLQILIEFSKPVTRAFPIMLLLFSEKATPSDFLVKHVYFWDEQTVQLYVPAAPWKGANVGYLSLLDADYDRKPPNKYLAGAVNYTVRFQWIQCVFWDKAEWRSEGPYPQPGTSPEKVNCSYRHLAPVSVLRRKLNATFENTKLYFTYAQYLVDYLVDLIRSILGTVSISVKERHDHETLINHPHSLLPCAFGVFFLVLYGFLVRKSRCVDRHEKKNPGCIFLEEDTPPGYQLYAVVIDTGFRSPARFTSKVFIVLCGESGCSETKELCCPEKPLFGRNSRHTFILSTPNRLGRLQKIRLWHDSSGPSPCWFISHVMVKELCSGQAWFFSAQCWLAVSKWDGHVLRDFFCLNHGLSFRKLFYSKFTEYLEDFHIWFSLYSHPPSSGYPPTQRLGVSFCLLCVYSCLTALVTAGGQDQGRPLEVGPTALTLESFSLALQCTLLACPAAQLLSLLFRCSKEARGTLRASPPWPLRGVKTEVPQGPDPSGRADLRQPSPMNSWILVPMLRAAVHSAPQLTAPVASHPTSDLLPGTDGAWRMAAGCSGMACSPFPLEACRDTHLALREKSHYSPPSSQAPSSGFEELGRQQSRVCLLWSSSVAWAISGSASLACSLGTGYLGYRVCAGAVYVVAAPAASLSGLLCIHHSAAHGFDSDICLAALAFAWKWKHDSEFFAESLRDATKGLDLELEERSRARIPLSPISHRPDSAEEAERRFGCPATRTPPALGSDAIQGQAQSDQGETEEREPHVGRPEPGVLGGQWHLIGPAIIKQLKVSGGTACTPPRPFSEPVEDALPMHSRDLDLENRNVTPGGPETCGVKKESHTRSLGRTRLSLSPGSPEGGMLGRPSSQGIGRHDTHAALTALRASRWIDHSTRAVAVHVTLYNPPTRLFTSVTLGAECLPTGGLVPSFLVESFSIFYSDSALKYPLMLSETAVPGTQHDPPLFPALGDSNQGLPQLLEKTKTLAGVSLTVGVALAYYATSGHLTTLAENITDQFHEGLYQKFVDVSLMVSWNQGTVLPGNPPVPLDVEMCSSPQLSERHDTLLSGDLFPSLQSLGTIELVGALLLAACSHLCWFLLFTGTLSRDTPAEAFPGLLHRFPGRSKKDSWHSRLEFDHGAVHCHYGTLFLLLAALGFGMLRATLLTVFQNRKTFHRKSLVTLKDIAVYTRHEALTLLGLETTPLGEIEVATDHKYYLDEFSSLLDELLMKIDGLSDSLELSILEKRALESRAGDSCSVGISEDQATGGIWFFGC